MPKTLKRIHKVVIKRMTDTDPDTSYLGEYSSQYESDYSIDGKHDTDCPQQMYNKTPKVTIEQLERIHEYLCGQYNRHLETDWCDWYDDGGNFIADHINDLENECTCGGQYLERNTYQYFNPNFRNYKGCDHAEIVKYCLQDYARMESLNNSHWCYIGIRAEASISIPMQSNNQAPDSINQTITSGGLYGIESDSDASYFAEIEQEQLSELREQLHGIGFSYRAIAAAFKDIERKED